MQKNKKIYEQYAIGKGFVQLRAIDQPKVKAAVMALLSQTTPEAFGKVRRGERRMFSAEYKAIEEIFAEYGVADPWGLVDKAD